MRSRRVTRCRYVQRLTRTRTDRARWRNRQSRIEGLVPARALGSSPPRLAGNGPTARRSCHGPWVLRLRARSGRHRLRRYRVPRRPNPGQPWPCPVRLCPQGVVERSPPSSAEPPRRCAGKSTPMAGEREVPGPDRRSGGVPAGVATPELHLASEEGRCTQGVARSSDTAGKS
jgi:hypothetical protein